MSASLISDIITNPMRLRAYVEKSGTSEINSHIPEYAIYNSEDDLILSDESLGDFVLDNAQFVYPFLGKVNEGRDQLSRANLTLRNGSSDLVSTDGHRLQVASIPVGFVSEEQDIDVSIPAKLISTLKVSGCLSFEVFKHKSVLTCFSRNTRVITICWKQPSEEFPPWEKVIPDVENEDRYTVPHSIPKFGTIPSNCRKKEMSLHFLSLHGEAIAEFGIMDDGDIIHLSSDRIEHDLNHTDCYLAVKSKYAWDVGKFLKKVDADKIILSVGSDVDPIRIDWELEGVEYTHVLMPFRQGRANTWPTAD